MNPLIAYLLKMMLISGVLYAYYHVVLKDKRFHQWNRFYLLSAVALSILIPLFHIPVQASVQDNRLLMKVLQLIGAGGDHSVTIRPDVHPGFLAGLTWKDAPAVSYAVIVLSLLSLFGYRLWYIRKLHHRSPRRHLENITLIETREGGAPFSFFRWIFWNQDVALGSTEGEHILRHELTHVRQRHSWDKIGMQLVCIVFFPVVFFYLIRRELQIIHEYLADKQAIRDKNIAAYAEILIGQVFQTSPYAFANHFSQHPLKRRIAMMTRFNNPRFTYLRKILFLPLAIGLFGILAFRAEARHRGLILRLEQATGVGPVPMLRTPGGNPDTARQKRPFLVVMRPGKNAPAPDKQDTTPPDGGRPFDSSMEKVLFVVDGGTPRTGGKAFLQSIDPASIQSIDILKDGHATSLYGPSAAHGVILITTKKASSSDTSGDDDRVFTKVEVEAQFPGGETAWNNYVRKAIMTHMNELRNAGQSGTCELQFIVHKDGSLSDIKALTMDGTVLGALCANMLITSPNWVPATQNGYKVVAYRRQKITFQMPAK
jgi:TonB-dependent SusC/RagA subfamily outer membrane receptor